MDRRTGCLTLTAALATAALAGCGTIDQVPLAYISTVKVGVSAESATAQVPGGKVMIGIEATDAALVPVAVGRACSGTVDISCNAATAPIELVRGNNDVSPVLYLKLAAAAAGTVKLASNAVRDAEKSRADTTAEVLKAKALTEAVDADTELLSGLRQEATKEQQRIAADPIAAIDPASDQRRQERDARIDGVKNRIAAAGDAAGAFRAASLREDAAQNRLELAYRGLATAQDRLDELLGKDIPPSGKREDALSVFGSFNADGSGSIDKAGAGLKLGKSFSTGVAAQLLTEGLKLAASSNAATACLDAAAKAGTNAVERKGAIDVCLLAQRGSGN